jgi:antitoxin Phd
MKMKTWPVQDAKARFSEMLNTCLIEGAQSITKRGVETAYLVSAEEWNRAKQGKPESLREFLLASVGKGELVLPERSNGKRRRSVTFD